ncbi:BTAD domain-containing putative transcriptional regulator [Amycolatopsis sp. NPDC048633]|uniref:AfsR/SARP family transcriptional regulator n=1 Tax=Amycolatopsis sp. NPDC048633 TaxID=3157095 RepID=UPI003400936F
MTGFRVLGEIAVLADGSRIDPGPEKQRRVLAVLVLAAGRVVPVERLIECVWDDAPPARARETLTSYVSRLRRLLAPGADVVRQGGGYRLQADPSAVDLHRFRELCTRARGSGDDRRSAERLQEALGIWHGEALSGLGGDWALAERESLHQERLTAECEHTDVLLRLGRDEHLLDDLTARVAAWPLDERVACQYLLALHRAGRTADALAHFQRVRGRLAEELGIDPGAALRALHQQILTAEPALTGDHATSAMVPRQLPAAPAPFVGRTEELDRLGFAVSGGPGATVVISAIAGAGGMGKTWLALHWAHRHAEEFVDGQLFVDLRGFSPGGQPMDPAVAVRGFLDAFGVEPARIPVDAQAQAALFRSLAAGKRILLVLDNAADTAQVVPLLPGSGSCTVLVTSRTQLPGLLTGHGARHLPLDVLSGAEATALLADRLGHARIRAEPAAVARLIGFCGGFPLALGIVAGQAATRPHTPLAGLVDELDESGLSALDGVEPTASLPAVLSWSFHALTSEQATAFALLGIAPGPDIDLPAASALVGCPLDTCRTVLRVLEQSSLISRDTRGRYRMHDLIRRYADDKAQDLPGEVRQDALRRVLDFYCHTAFAADRRLAPHRHPIELDPAVPGARPGSPLDDKAAMTWFDDAYATLLAAQQVAVAQGRYPTVWQLAWALTTFQHRAGHRKDHLAMWEIAAESITRRPGGAGDSLVQRLLGGAYAERGRYEDATRHLDEALTLAVDHRDDVAHAYAHRVLAWTWARRGNDHLAAMHADDALDLFRGLGKPVWEAEALNALGWYTARLGDHETALEHCRAALDLFRDSRDPSGEAATLDSLGYIQDRLGQHRSAVEYYEQAVHVLRELGYSYEIANTLDNLGHAHAALGGTAQARTVWSEALELYRRQDRPEEAERARRRLDALDEQAPAML